MLNIFSSRNPEFLYIYLSFHKKFSFMFWSVFFLCYETLFCLKIKNYHNFLPCLQHVWFSSERLALKDAQIAQSLAEKLQLFAELSECVAGLEDSGSRSRLLLRGDTSDLQQGETLLKAAITEGTSTTSQTHKPAHLLHIIQLNAASKSYLCVFLQWRTCRTSWPLEFGEHQHRLKETRVRLWVCFHAEPTHSADTTAILAYCLRVRVTPMNTLYIRDAEI